MDDAWAKAVKSEILATLKNQNAHRRFIGKKTLQTIWKTVFQQSSHYAIDPGSDIYQVRDQLTENQDDQSLLILASILVWIDWNNWDDFTRLFTDGNGNANFKLPLGEDSALHLLGHKGLNFCHSQSIFLPKTITEGENLHFSIGDRLPFEEKDCQTSAGVSGAVKKIVVVRGYFRDLNGNTNQQPRVLARKRFHYPDDYMKEIRILNTIRQNLRQHTHILAHMGTLAIGTEDFSILSEFADNGDLHQFLHGDFTGFMSHRDRIIEEASNIADAIEFLHKSFRIDGDHRPCYHLDLKPANILVFSRRHRPPEMRDGVGEWVITDFGVSVLHERIAEGISKTSPRREPGTYQPPEIDETLGLPSVNAKGDVWSLGGILCIILAFLNDGKRSVEWLDHIRSRTAAGPQDQDFYYVVEHHGNQVNPALKPQIQGWLCDIQSARPGVAWVTGMVSLVQDCLNVDQHSRPDACTVYQRLHRLQARNELRIKTAPDLPLKSEGPMPSYSTASPSPGLRTSFLQRFKHRRAESQPVLQTPTRQVSVPVKPPQVDIRSPSHDSGLPATPPSTGSAANFNHSPSSVENLNPTGRVTSLRIEPSGQHIVLCLPEKALIFDLIPGRETQPVFEQRQKPINGTFDGVYLAGHYLLLYEKATSKASLFASVSQYANRSQPTFEILTASADSSFSKLAETPEKFISAWKTAISPFGDVALIQSRTLRTPKYLSLDFRIPDDIMGKEIFQTVCFNRTGSRLWACGMKHWFMWVVDPFSPTWLHSPKTGAFTVSLDWKVVGSSMFVFNHRDAFCLYDKGMRTLRLFDADQNFNTQVTLDPTLLCAVVGSRDDQIFYVRLHDPGGGLLSKSRRTVGLYRRPIQGMKIGSEALLTELLGLDPRAAFEIACRDEDTTQILTIVSTEGKYQSHRLDLEGAVPAT